MSSVVDSKHQKLSTDEIIAIAAKETGGKYTAEQIKASLVGEIHDMKGTLLREGNTLFIVHRVPSDPTIAQFRALNADTASNYAKNAVVFTKAIGMAGVKYMVSQFEDKALINIFKYVSKHPPFKNMGYQVERTENGEYKVTVNLGDAKAGGLPDKSVPETGGAI